MILFSTLIIPIVFITLFNRVNNECWHSEILTQEPYTSDHLLGPGRNIQFDVETIPKIDIPNGGNFTLNFWMKYDDFTQVVGGIDTILGSKFTALYLSSASPSDPTQKLFMEVYVHRRQANAWDTYFKNDKEEDKLTDNMYNYRNNWWFVSLASTNNWRHPSVPAAQPDPDPQQIMRIVYDTSRDRQIALDMNEKWNFDGLALRLFSKQSTDVKFFNGRIARVDWYINDPFAHSHNKYKNYDMGIPKPIYLLDFTDPEHAQYLSNKIAGSGYDHAQRGKTNHSDIHDFFFNPVNEFSQRHYNHYIMLPTFIDLPHVRQNHIYHIKYRGWALNHWHQGSLYMENLHRYNSGGGRRYGLTTHKRDHSTRIRAIQYFYYGRTICYFYVESGKPNHEAYTTGYGVIMHFFGPFWKPGRSWYSYGCNGYMNAGPYNTYNRGVAANDYYMIGKKNTQGYDFPDRPFRTQQDIQVEINFHYLLILEGGYRSSPDADFPSVCNVNSLEEYGTGENGFRGSCVYSSTPSYAPYWEVNKCLQTPLSDDFKDCKHDMDTAGSLCHRCPRYYGKTGVEGCFKCPDNCLECVGPNSDQCKYCGMGYGFTGTSCRKCTEDETWDLSTNLCQKKKIRFLEAEYGLRTFGEIKLIFRPLDGEADLSLYVENMYDKFWMTDINRQYYLIRKYEDLPLHRKVSVSVEFMLIDTRSYRYFYINIDDEYIYSYTPNCEDDTVGITADFWGYGYKDQPPVKVSFTRFHSGPTMELGIVGFWGADWSTIWVRQLNVTFFGCYEACATCWEDNSPVHCITCLPGYYLLGSECKACHPNCATCDITATKCTSCPQSEFLKGISCVITCGLGFYSDVSNVCQNCPNECVQCNSPTACNSCKNKYFLSGSACVACNAANCVTCTATANKCLSCQPAEKLRDFTCVGACGIGWFEVPGNICNPCPPGCITCTSTNCLTCDLGWKKKNNICANPCGDNWYDLDAGNCAACDSQCQTCSGGPSSCDTCKGGHAQTPPACPPCTSPCQTCSTSSTTCVSCSGIYYLTGTSCVDASSCPATTYAKSNVCEPCTPPCANCIGTNTKCISCVPGTVLFGFTCPLTCPAGFTEFSGSCCPDSCSACSDTETCSACNNGFYLSGVKCLPCDGNCKTCDTSANNCLTCNLPDLLQVNVCVGTCSDKYYPNGLICSGCDSTCATCTGPTGDDCDSCIIAHMLFQGICQDCANAANPYFIAIENICWDKCGAGTRFTSTSLPGLGGYNACDDGNLINGDGCSSDCRIEKNYRCDGGTDSTPDICYSKIKPQASIHEIYNDKYQMQFSKPVVLKNEDNSNSLDVAKFIKVELKGFKSPDDFTVKWDLKRTGDWISYLNVTFTFSSTIPPSTKLTFIFDRMKLLDVNSNTLKNQKVISTAEYLIPDRFVAEAILNVTAKAGRYLDSVTSVASLGVTNYVVQNWVRGVAGIKSVGYSSLINVKKSNRMKLVLEGARGNQNSKTFSSPSVWFREQFTGEKVNKEGQVDPAPEGIENRRLVDVEGGTGTGVTAKSSFASLFLTTTASTQFSDAGYTNAMIPNLSFSIVMVFIGALWYFLSSFFCGHRITKRSNFFMRFLVYGGERCFWISMMVSSLELSIFSTNNLLNSNFSHNGELFSFIAAAFTFFFLLMFPYIIYNITKQEFETLWNPEYYSRYAFFFCEFKLNKKINKCFMAIIMGRLILFGIIIAALQSKAVLQTIAILALNVIYTIILLRNKPFVSKVMNIITIIAEILFVISSVCFFLSAIEDSSPKFGESARDMIDLISLYCMTGGLALTIFGMIYMTILKILQSCKKCFYTKKASQVLTPRDRKPDGGRLHDDDDDESKKKIKEDRKVGSPKDGPPKKLIVQEVKKESKKKMSLKDDDGEEEKEPDFGDFEAEFMEDKKIKNPEFDMEAEFMKGIDQDEQELDMEAQFMNDDEPNLEDDEKDISLGF